MSPKKVKIIINTLFIVYRPDLAIVGISFAFNDRIPVVPAPFVLNPFNHLGSLSGSSPVILFNFHWVTPFSLCSLINFSDG